jgi:hypothetical protein
MIRQRIWTKRAEYLDYVVRIAFAHVEYGRGEQDCSRALNEDASSFAPVLFRHFDWLSPI